MTVLHLLTVDYVALNRESLSAEMNSARALLQTLCAVTLLVLASGQSPPAIFISPPAYVLQQNPLNLTFTLPNNPNEGSSVLIGLTCDQSSGCCLGPATGVILLTYGGAIPSAGTYELLLDLDTL